MIVELQNTTSAQIGQRILASRQKVGVPTGLVFTLIAVAEGCDPADVLAASIDAGREHPSRVLVVTNGPGDTRLDAVVRVGGEVPGDIVELTFRGELVRHRDSALLPLLLPDSPVVVWWPGTSPDVPADDPVGRLARRRITDAMGSVDPITTLVERARNYSPGDTDLVWTRLTRWRGLLASAVDHYPFEVRRARVRAAAGNAAGMLLAAWLDDRLGVEVLLEDDPDGAGITGAVLETVAGDISLSRTDGTMAAFSAPGVERRLVALPRRDLNALITEELRRLDEDAAYATTMATLAARWNAASTPAGSPR